MQLLALFDDHDPGDEDATAARDRYWLPVTRPENSGQHPKASYGVPLTTGKPPAPPAWRVSRHEVKIGEVYYIEPGIDSHVRPGRVRVDRVLHDNLDGCVAAYVEITVVYLDAPWPTPRRLAGPAIEYHLRRLT